MNVGINVNKSGTNVERPVKGKIEECMERLRNTSLNSNSGINSTVNDEAVKLKKAT
jgi:2-iminoacetate synthase ThiH